MGKTQGELIIAEHYTATVYYVPTREWLVHWDRVSGFDSATPTTDAILNSPLNGAKFPCKHPENVMSEAYVNDDCINCVIRQLNA